VAADDAGRPVLVFASFPSASDHRYSYARWTGAAWDVHEFLAAGGSISADGKEEQYSGGMSLDHEDPSRVYLSRQVGSGWRVEVWITPDGGATWSSQVVSDSSVKNVRPVSPRGMRSFDADLSIVWMRGTYPSYLTYETSLAALLARPLVQEPPATPIGTAHTVAVRMAGRVVRFDRRGRGRLDVRCLAASGDVCKVKGGLELRRRGAKSALRVGRFAGKVGGGRLGSVPAKLTRAGLHRLLRARHLRARAVGTVRNGFGAKVSGRWPARLGLARRPRPRTGRRAAALRRRP
jgi:hypothetical protein